MKKTMLRVSLLLVIFTLVLTACGGAKATQAPAAATEAPATGSLQIPDVESGKFNVAMVLIGPHDDGGWSLDGLGGWRWNRTTPPFASPGTRDRALSGSRNPANGNEPRRRRRKIR